jgi:hypothetical protein
VRPDGQLNLVVVLAHEHDRSASAVPSNFIQRAGMDIADRGLDLGVVGTDFTLFAVVTGVEK